MKNEHHSTGKDKQEMKLHYDQRKSLNMNTCPTHLLHIHTPNGQWLGHLHMHAYLRQSPLLASLCFQYFCSVSRRHGFLNSLSSSIVHGDKPCPRCTSPSFTFVVHVYKEVPALNFVRTHAHSFQYSTQILLDTQYLVRYLVTFYVWA